MKTSPHILIVEDDEFLGPTLVEMVESLGYVVTLAVNGQRAIEVLERNRKSLEPIRLVLTDCNMPVVNGLELLAWVKKNLAIPTILMTGYFDGLTTQNALDNGATEFLIKPFEPTGLATCLEKCLVEKSSPELESSLPMDEKIYCRIPLHLLNFSSAVAFNLYRKRDSQLFKILSTSDQLDNRVQLAEIESGDFDIYTERASLHDILQAGLIPIRAGIVNPHSDRSRVVNLLQRAADLLFNNLRFADLDQELLKSSGEVVECLIAATAETPAVDMLCELEKFADHVFAHSMGVSSISAMLAQRLGWPADQLLKVTLAAFFHDIGTIQLGAAIVAKANPLLSFSERTQRASHPTLGAERLRSSGLFGEEICTMVAQHHENNLGSGYPARLSGAILLEGSKLIHLADVFCDHVIPNPDSLGMPPTRALGLIEALRAEFESSHVEALRGIFDRELRSDAAGSRIFKQVS